MDGDLGRVVHQQVDVIVLTVELNQFRLEVGTDAGEYPVQVIEDFLGEHFAAIFGHKDQMHMHQEYVVLSVPNIVVVAHRPNYTIRMQRLQAFKYELIPDGQQARQMRRFAGSCRFVFNKALALQKARYERGEKKLGYTGLCKLLTEWRNSAETTWLADAPVHPLQQTLKDLERAYSNFFAKRADFPRFKKKTSPIIAVPPQNTSRTCPCCGHVSADNRQTQAKFLCVECGFEENADAVGAINVLRAGHARLACEVSGAVMPPAAGTHRSDSGAAQCRA